MTTYRVKGQQGRWTSDLYCDGRKVETLPAVTDYYARQGSPRGWPHYFGPIASHEINKADAHYRLLAEKGRVVLHQRVLSENGEPLPRRGAAIGVYRIHNLHRHPDRIEFDIDQIR